MVRGATSLHLAEWFSKALLLTTVLDATLYTVWGSLSIARVDLNAFFCTTVLDATLSKVRWKFCIFIFN